MVRYSIAYETTIKDNNKEQKSFPFKTSIPLSQEEDDVIYSGSFQDNIKVLQKVVERVHPELLGSKKWTCKECKRRPASVVIGDCCNLQFPDSNDEPAKLVHYNPSLVCSKTACMRRASHADRMFCKEFKAEARGQEGGCHTKFFCKKCGKTETPGGPKMMRCARCRFVWYCNKHCQTADWAEHKKHCCGGSSRSR